MDQHPVPQDVTNFQFKLVGDMTLKQFGLLAGGCVIAFMFYSANWHPFLRFPLALFSFIAGISFAFIPIEERPMDTWVINFFKSVYRPTQYVWKKGVNKLEMLSLTSSQTDQNKDPLSTANLPKTDSSKDNLGKLEEYLETLPNTNLSPPESKNKSQPADDTEKPEDKIIPVTATIAPMDPVTKPQPQPPSTSPSDTKNILSVEDLMKRRESELMNRQKTLDKVAKELEDQKPSKVVTVENLQKIRDEQKTAPNDQAAKVISDYQKRLDETQSLNQAMATQMENLKKQIEQLQKQTETKEKDSALHQEKLNKLSQNLNMVQREKTNLNKELSSLQRQLEIANKAIPIKNNSEDIRAKFIQKDQLRQQLSSTFNLPPNTISGLIKNSQDQIIDNVIVLVKNIEGSPVRALRTNKIGQFLASTPLENGKYYIELEKEGYEFDLVEINLDGSVLSPIEIKAKT